MNDAEEIISCSKMERNISQASYRQCILPVSPSRGRNIAIMTTQDQVPKIDFADTTREQSSKLKDESSQLAKQQRKMMRQRSICSPRRLMNSPPPKHTPPFPPDDLSPNSRSSLSPSPRRISVSTPLYVINTNSKSATPPPPLDQRPLTPCMLSRPVLMKMATITSPTLSRPVSPQPSRSLDDSGCNYSSLHGQRKENLVEDEIRDSVRLQKMFRKLQRQIHSPDHQVDCHFFEPPGLETEKLFDVGAAPRRLTLGNIGRSETVASPEPSKPPVRQQRERGSSLEKITTATNFNQRRMLDPPSFSTSSMVDPDISIELDSVSSAVVERPCTLPEVNSRPASRVMKSFSCDGISQPLTAQEDLENQKRKTASAIVTSGALTFMILAAALVTASFLMSPVIEDVFVHRKMNQTNGEMENSTFPIIDDLPSFQWEPQVYNSKPEENIEYLKSSEAKNKRILDRKHIKHV